MARVYFDKQIFSYLFKAEEEKYKSLYGKLKAAKEHLTYCYSHAHLLDLRNDLTNKKYEELDFMETLVDDNYLQYDFTEKATSCYLAKPREAFDSLETVGQVSNFEDLFNIETDDPLEQQLINSIKEFIRSFKVDFGGGQDIQLPEDYPEPLKNLMSGDNGIQNLGQAIDYLLDLNSQFEKDKKLYKNLRNYSNQFYSKEKFTIKKGDIDFELNANNSKIKMSFNDFIDPVGDNSLSRYQYYTKAYTSLDLLGFEKDASKNLKYKNLINDAIHSYYGAYCDYVVSDDQGFLNKTKVLFRLFEIETKVLSAQEFIDSFDVTINSIETDHRSFSNLLVWDLKNGFTCEIKDSLRFNRTTRTIKPIHRYMGHFNYIDVMREDGKDYINFYKRFKNYSNFSFYREYQKIINNAIRIFGMDLHFKGEYKWPEENQEIKNNKWEGRSWDFESYTVLIEINEGLKEICMLLSFAP